MPDGAKGVVGGAGVSSSVANRHVAQVHVADHLSQGGSEAADTRPASTTHVGELEVRSGQVKSCKRVFLFRGTVNLLPDIYDHSHGVSTLIQATCNLMLEISN